MHAHSHLSSVLFLINSQKNAADDDLTVVASGWNIQGTIHNRYISRYGNWVVLKLLSAAGMKENIDILALKLYGMTLKG